MGGGDGVSATAAALGGVDSPNAGHGLDNYFLVPGNAEGSRVTRASSFGLEHMATHPLC